MRGCLTSPLRRLLVLGVVFLVPLVSAAGLAWACGPASYTTVQPSSGAAATDATVTGRDFPPGPVELRWDTRAGPVLKTTQGPSFATQVTIPNAPAGVHYLVALSRYEDGSIAYQSAAPFTVTPPSLALQPASGASGATTTATGKLFGPGPVEIHWGTPGGALLHTAAGPNFTTSVTIPDRAPGDYSIVAFSRDSSGNQAGLASARFQVTATPVPPAAPADDVAPTLQVAPVSSPPPPPDKTGPAILDKELTRQNGARTVSRKGEVRVFCGRFTEGGVSGVCGATSARSLTRARTRGEPRRSGGLRLGSKTFQAVPGRPVLLKFVLDRPSMKALVAARKVRLRGWVRARDASGNATKASFAFTLKAPPGSR